MTEYSNPTEQPEGEIVVNPDSKELKKTERHGVKATVIEYVDNKIKGEKDPNKQFKLKSEMQERVISVARRGAKEVNERIKVTFPIEINTENAESYTTQLVQEQQEVLAGQPEKVARMKSFVADMSEQAEALIANASQLAENNPILATREEKDAFINKYTNEIRKLVVDATRAITHQDAKASGITLGDHGWMHLTQDARDARIIAEGKKGQPLTSTEGFLISIAAAYHDIGYAVPEVTDKQFNSNGKYGSFDKGHPINSYVYLVSQKQRFQRILGNEAADALFQIVANHENPDRKKRAGKFADIAEAFALADASAAFGIDKLPPVISQAPECLAYMNAISNSQPDTFRTIYNQLPEPRVDFNTALAEFTQEVVVPLKNQATEAIRERVTNSEQANALVNALDHFGELSKKFLLGRMSAESTAISVGADGKVQFEINAGYARMLDKDGTVTDATTASAKLTVKLFLEQAALQVSKNVEQLLIASVANGELPTNIYEDDQAELEKKGIQISSDTTGQPEDHAVLLSTSAIAVKSYTNRLITARNEQFYGDVQANLATTNTMIDQFVKKRKNAGPTQ